MTDFRPRDAIAALPSIDRRSVKGVTWPVSPLSLAALTDMGMTDQTIGRYFGVDPAEVRQERENRERDNREREETTT